MSRLSAAFLVLLLPLVACDDDPPPSAFSAMGWEATGEKTFSFVPFTTSDSSESTKQDGTVAIELVQQPEDGLGETRPYESLGCRAETQLAAAELGNTLTMTLDGECRSPDEGHLAFVRVAYAPTGTSVDQAPPGLYSFEGAPEALGGTGRTVDSTIAAGARAQRDEGRGDELDEAEAEVARWVDSIRAVARAHASAGDDLPRCHPRLSTDVTVNGTAQRVDAAGLAAAAAGSPLPDAAHMMRVGRLSRLDMLRRAEAGEVVPIPADQPSDHGHPAWVQVVDIESAVEPELVGGRYTRGSVRGSVTVVHPVRGALCRSPFEHVQEADSVRIEDSVEDDPAAAIQTARDEFWAEVYVEQLDGFGPPP